MDRKIEKYIIQFVEKISEIYDDVHFGFDYDPVEDEFDIWHDSFKYQFQDQQFLAVVGTLLKEVLYSNNIFNVSFGYDCVKAINNTMVKYSTSFQQLTRFIVNEPVVKVNSVIPKYKLSTDLDFHNIEPSLKISSQRVTSFNSQAYYQLSDLNNMSKYTVEESTLNNQKELAA